MNRRTLFHRLLGGAVAAIAGPRVTDATVKEVAAAPVAAKTIEDFLAANAHLISGQIHKVVLTTSPWTAITAKSPDLGERVEEAWVERHRREYLSMTQPR